MRQGWAQPAESIGGVVEALDAVVSQAGAAGSPLGYFAALYRSVTVTVAEGIEVGFFDDGARMERLDVVFANRYLAALEAFQSGRDPSRCWAVAFGAADSSRPVVLQHLLVGINAHINLDLGVAAAQVAPGDALPGLRRDFDRINEILAMMSGRAQQALAEISPWLGLLDVVGGRTDDQVVRFSIEVARTEAWRLATELAPLAAGVRTGPIATRDRLVARLGRRVLQPGLLSAGLWLIGLRESSDVGRNLAVLAGISAPDLGAVEARIDDPGRGLDTDQAS